MDASSAEYSRPLRASAPSSRASVADRWTTSPETSKAEALGRAGAELDKAHLLRQVFPHCFHRHADIAGSHRAADEVRGQTGALLQLDLNDRIGHRARQISRPPLVKHHHVLHTPEDTTHP